MKIKTSELIGSALDWAVAKCEGVYWNINGYFVWNALGHRTKYSKECPAYSSDWAQGGPIIERENIVFGFDDIAPPDKAHIARKPGFITIHNEFYGPTKLIAAMRCYVASKLGDEVEIPEELE